MTYLGFDGLEYYDREWDDMKRPDPEPEVYQAAMEKLDRVEDILRTVRKGLLGPGTAVGHGVVWKDVVARIIQVAIDRAVSKRIRLVTNWWKEPVL